MIESLAPANDSFSLLFLFPAKRIIVSYMTNKEIIASIQKQLTGDKTHDTGLLSRCSEEYQDNKEVFQYIQSILDGFENQMDKFESQMNRMEESQKCFEEETRNNFADIRLHLENITDRNISILAENHLNLINKMDVSATWMNRIMLNELKMNALTD